jgi:hypothetical protein
MNLRRAFLLSLVLATACASFDYQWVFDPLMPECEAVRWVKVEKTALKGLCSDGSTGADKADACVLGCVVVSRFSESEAKRVRERGGRTLYAHEVHDHIEMRSRHQ